MKKQISICYIALIMVMLLVPFAGMFFGLRTDETTENKTLAEFPSITAEDGSLNTDFLTELGDYFNDHFALREQLVNADAVIMANVFATSNVDTVVVGTDGWLYYTATVGDYQGTSTLSDRALYNAAYNLKLVQDYVESTGATFVVTIPANKNTLYGENMPYYYASTADHSNSRLCRIQSALEENGVNYADLLTAFESATDPLL